MAKHPIKARYSKEAKAFGIHLKTLRINKDMTQEDLAFNADISFTTINLMEGGKLNPTFATLVAVSKALDVPMNRLMDF